MVEEQEEGQGVPIASIRPPQKRRLEDMGHESENGVSESEKENEELLEDTMEAEEDAGPVSVLLCVLNQTNRSLRNRKIWRRIAVPSDFNLLELHVALQNAFDWEDQHLHNFQQARSNPFGAIPVYTGFGRTDVNSLPIVDIDSVDPTQVRTFQALVGIDDATGGELLTSAIPGRSTDSIVAVQHSHPHAGVGPLGSEAGEGQNYSFARGPCEVLEERAFRVKDVLTVDNPVLVYEYDFGVSHEVVIFFEGEHAPTQGINYPTCLGGAGASRAEDGNDMDDSGNLLPSYDYDEFAVLEVVRHMEKTYEHSWPAGPGAEDNREVNRCYMCRYNRECRRRQQCTGSCCDYCLKSEVAQAAGPLRISDADKYYDESAAAVVKHRKEWIDTGVCTWQEEGSLPCAVCNQ
eukprot:TRINITY_DN957_c0_g1_i1.p1 TRINITY_DN957_c0_g1~~TRINITY_DN957_c0_g1_i1.p1  ORF type:complete len:405 (+),score=79.12 TRINITY_DN957_c0_g1_i1:54-1268(+)